jgi:hypothetical protein
MSDPDGGIFAKVVVFVLVPYYWVKAKFGGKKS